jgi:hypothetical protein
MKTFETVVAIQATSFLLLWFLGKPIVKERKRGGKCRAVMTRSAPTGRTRSHGDDLKDVASDTGRVHTNEKDSREIVFTIPRDRLGFTFFPNSLAPTITGGAVQVFQPLSSKCGEFRLGWEGKALRLQATYKDKHRAGRLPLMLRPIPAQITSRAANLLPIRPATNQDSVEGEGRNKQGQKHCA